MWETDVDISVMPNIYKSFRIIDCVINSFFQIFMHKHVC